MRVIRDRYELTAPLATGGMGVLWEGRDQRLNRPIAVKLIRRDGAVRGDEATRRFYREARITARIRHPGVPTVHDFGTAGDEVYLVMEQVTGHTTADLIAELERIPVGWAVAITAQVSAVLAAAHQLSLIHRDLKPSNIMIGLDGSVTVLDFGLAAALGLDEFSQITLSGEIPGTACYLAPEVIDGDPASPRSDLYSLGCLLYELLTGTCAVAAGSRSLRPAIEARPDVHPQLAALVAELLAKNSDERPPDARDVFTRLLPFVTGLAPIPGITQPGTRTSPTQMYATVQERISRS